MDETDVEMVAEQADNLITFTGAHHAGIDVNASKLIANGLMQKNGDDRTVAAGKPANYAPVADLRADIGNRFSRKAAIVQLPRHPAILWVKLRNSAHRPAYAPG